MKFQLRNIFPIFIFALVIIGCSREEVYEVYEEPRTLLEESYGNDAAQKMDIYLPAGRSQSDTKVLVLIHGGGWMAGDKKDMASFVPKFQAQLRDYAVVNLNYRLANFSPRYMLPTQTDDIHAAMDYISNHASEYGIKPHFVLAGLSAGGHLAMLYAYKYDVDNRVKAVVNIVGPSDLSDSYYTNNFVYNFGMQYITAPENLPENMSLSEFGSPATWIRDNAPPTISFYGTDDGYIPTSQHTALELALSKSNIPNERYIYTGGHDVGYLQSDDIVAKTKEFLTKHVR